MNKGEAKSSKQCNPAYWFIRIFSSAYHHRFHSEHKKGTLWWEAWTGAWNARFRIEQRKWNQEQCKQLNTGALQRRNALNTNGPARVKRRMQWEAYFKPLAVDDPLLLPEREVPVEISITWFLDQDIPSQPKGYVRILEELLPWEKHLGKTRMRETKSLPTCIEMHRGWTIASSSWNFYESDGWDRKQEIITVIQEEAKRTEEKEETGHRSPTW